MTANDSDTVSVLAKKGEGSFTARRDYVTGSGPDAVAIGDLNGDGRLDLATANLGYAGNTASVLLNRGGGRFQRRRDYRTAGADSVAIADLNGDRKLDLATANGNNEESVSVLLNSGGGSFLAKVDYPSGSAQALGIGDLNGDRKLDVATANSTDNTVSVLISTPGLCTVQDVLGKTLEAAKRTLARAGCGVGKIRRVYSKMVRRGRVIAQKPSPLTVLRGGAKVNLVVSRGRRR